MKIEIRYDAKRRSYLVFVDPVPSDPVLLNLAGMAGYRLGTCHHDLATAEIAFHWWATNLGLDHQNIRIVYH